MNLKQFLKPDWRKIVIFVILFIITFIGLYSTSAGSGTTFSFTQLIFYIIMPFAYLAFVLPRYLPFLNSIPDILMFPIFLLQWFVYQYLLSCFIVWIYDKFKVKKK